MHPVLGRLSPLLSLTLYMMPTITRIQRLHTLPANRHVPHPLDLPSLLVNHLEPRHPNPPTPPANPPVLRPRNLLALHATVHLQLLLNPQVLLVTLHAQPHPSPPLSPANHLALPLLNY
eukprot:TRINITY_DN21464_c0_g1_i1.p2 TRINITY_DN21464_c0_g1~~TRINITY_DN21464_c0_g1_i1.p2  ORF type:complete len:119 (+),score=16.46 TRINITY_DN21464_c0_g1_i1:66-422(+)